MQRHVLGPLTCIVLIGVMSAFLVMRGEPEETYAASADGVVTVSGVARATQDVAIVVNGSGVYTLKGDAALDVPVTLTFQAAPGKTVYRYNDDYRMWEILEGVRIDEGMLAVQTAQLGDYMLGEPEIVDVPLFLEEYAALRAIAPKNAVGYAIVVGFAREGEPFVRLQGQGEQGGCGGAVLPGEYEAQSVRERQASLLVDDVQTMVHLQFLATWQLRDEGCAQLSPFLPAAEHAILPVSY